MPGTTTLKKLRYPTATDAPDGPGAVFNLATDVDAALSSATTFGPADLNTYFTASGAYRGSGLTNAPRGSSGSFLVLVNMVGTIITQIAFKLDDGTVWTRVSSNGGTSWGPWVAANATANDTGGGDWNAITAPGTYLGGGAASNSPTNAAGTYYYFQVLNTGGTGDLMQVAYGISSGNRGVWYRVRAGGTWTTWTTVASDTGWSFAPLAAATGWSTMTDPAGVSSGSTLRGGVRNLNGLVEYRFRLTRTGSAIVATASGNITPDNLAATVSAATWPNLVPPLTVIGQFEDVGVQGGYAQMDNAGNITLAALYPSQQIATGDVIQISLFFLQG